jgi:hypothetical protein
MTATEAMALVSNSKSHKYCDKKTYKFIQATNKIIRDSCEKGINSIKFEHQDACIDYNSVAKEFKKKGFLVRFSKVDSRLSTKFSIAWGLNWWRKLLYFVGIDSYSIPIEQSYEQV